MANAILVNDLVVTKVWCISVEQASVNRVWFLCTAIAGTGGTDLQLAGVIDGFAAPNFKLLINNSSTYRGVQAQIYRAGQPFVAAQTIASTGAGTGGTLPLPRQCAGILTLNTGFAGRRFRGRMYIPFPSGAEDVINGVPTAGYITNLQALATLYFATQTAGSGGNTSTLIPVLVHGKGKSAIPIPTPITGTIAQPKFATQRRRGSYGRANTSPI